jgi:hypothetical protein
MKQVSVDREDEKEGQQPSSSSSQVLLSEAWELYF